MDNNNITQLHNITPEEFKKEVSKPLNIPDKALRQEIYKQNYLL